MLINVVCPLTNQRRRENGYARSGSRSRGGELTHGGGCHCGTVREAPVLQYLRDQVILHTAIRSGCCQCRCVETETIDGERQRSTKRPQQRPFYQSFTGSIPTLP